MPDKVPCEGCGAPWSPGYISSHRKGCAPYREWSRALPYQCPCGLGFATERSLRSHKKGCDQAVATPHLERCVCGGRYPNLRAHYPECPGPPDAASITLTYPAPPDDRTCVCGHVSGTPASRPNHTVSCPQWWAYRRGLPVKCEGCGVGFTDQLGKRAHAQVCGPWQQWRAARDLEEKKHPCPSCGTLMRGPQLGLHVNACPGPWTRADWERWRGRRSREEREAQFASYGGEGEGVTHLTCALCGLRFLQLAEHLVKAHGTTAARYRALTGRPTKAEEIRERTRSTLQARHWEGADHPAKIPGHWGRCLTAFRVRYGGTHSRCLEEFRLKWTATSMKNYGVPHPLQSLLVQEKLRATNRAVYGADYYFASDAFKQWSWVKYGAPHPMWNRDYVLRLFEKLSAGRPGPNKFERRVWDPVRRTETLIEEAV